jgi:DNA-binding PadR family transcriptional regulator
MRLHWAGTGSGRRHCAGRHSHGPGFGGLFGGLGRGDFGWHAFRAGRKLGSEDLQLVILALLEDKPSHGYEIIKAIEERSSGFYSPSPGMVYPALTYLEEIGYASVRVDGTRKLYTITDAGRTHLEQNRGVVDAMLAQLKWIGEKMSHFRNAFSGEDQSADATSSKLRESRRRLKVALAEKEDASEDEQRRIAEILDRATDEIRGR